MRKYIRIISALLTLVMIVSVLPIGSLRIYAQTEATNVTTAAITVESNGYAMAGKTVAVDLILKNNPGILGMTLKVNYDESIATLTSVENGDALSYMVFTTPKDLSSGCKLPWDAETVDEAALADGIIAKLTFEIAEDAPVNEPFTVGLSYDTGAIIDQNMDNLSISVGSSDIYILDYLPGDLNEDGLVNTTDVVLLRRYVAGGYGVSIKEVAADVNDDGILNTTDVVRIRRFVADGCTYDINGYGVKLLFPTPKCAHTMEAISYKAATCTEDGNISYYHCIACDKYFNNEAGTVELTLADTVIKASHSLTAIEEKNPSYTEDGNIAYWYCSVCKKYFSDAAAGEEITYEETIIPKLQSSEYLVEYDVANGDPYLQKLVDNGTLKNPNPSSYAEGTGLTLTNLSAAGYRFLGWYDLAENGTLVKKIDTTATGNYQLYAYWSKIEYTVQYKSSLFVDRAQDTYTVDTGLVLPTPKLSNYSFVGWSDENGKLLTGTAIPVGSTGNLILEANWTSERNKTWTKPTLDAPIIDIDEENGVILFAYEIGEVQNVPLYTIKDFGYISGEGITKTESATYKVTITDTMMKSYAKSVAMATTESSNWTLANTWNSTTSVNEEWCQENGKNIEEVDEIAKSDSQNWNISNSKSGSTETTSTTTNQDGWKNEVKVNSSSSSTDTESSTNKTTSDEAWNVDGKLTYTPKSYSFGIDIFEVGGFNASESGGWGGEIGGGYEHKWGEENTETEEHSDTTSSGLELGGTHDKSTLTTSGTTSTASWNNTSSYGGSSTNSATHTNSIALSEKISKAYGYGSSYATGGESGSSQGLSSSQSDSESYSSSVTYSTETSEEITSEWTTQSTKAGYHRWVVAGTAHVFAVVGYDMTTNSYFVYTYSVMDDETYEFEDYSYTSAAYNDHENGVISFEIPYEVAEYVEEKTSYSDGLKVNQETGIIEEYNGKDTCVVIPEYWNVGNGDVVKVTGIAENAFKGNTNISAVVLSDFITEIPDRAFQGCTSLKEIIGGNITRIGSYAFDGCTDAEDLGVRSSVEYLGEKAFGGVQRIIVNASDKDVLKAAVESGAEQIIVSLEYLENGEEALKGMELTVPSGTKFFELNGNYKTYEDFSLVSKADITVLNKIHFVGTSRIPVIIHSAEVVLNQSTITASGIGLVLCAEVTHLGLQGNVTVQSANENAVLAKGLNLYEINKNVVGKLIIKNKLLQCGTTEGSSYLSYEEYEEIDQTTFENLLNSFTLYFDANGGSCDEESRSVPNSTKLGTLPVATREHYIFDGWFLADGTEVTEDSVFSTGADIYVYAKWTIVPYTVSWNTGTGYSITVNRTSSPNANAETGVLSSGDAVYYGDVLAIIYTKHDYYSISAQGATSVVVESNVTTDTIYAEAALNPVSGWVLASEMPSDAQVINQKWTYTLTTNTESTATSLSGYTQVGSYWVKSGSGSKNYATFPSGFETSHWIWQDFSFNPYTASETTTTKREVSNSWTGYVYWHWMYDCGGANAGDRAIYNQYGYGSTNGYLYKYFGAFTSATNYPSTNGYCNNLGLSYYGTGRTSYADSQGSKYWFRFDYYTSSYTDYYKMFKYQKQEQKESSTEVTPSSTISNVQYYVQYRDK